MMDDGRSHIKNCVIGKENSFVYMSVLVLYSLETKKIIIIIARIQ